MQNMGDHSVLSYFKKYLAKSTHCLYNILVSVPGQSYSGYSTACANNKLSFESPWLITAVARRITDLTGAQPFQAVCKNLVHFNKLYFWMQLHHRI